MPIIRTRYRCELCGSEWETEAEALACEAAGWPDSPHVQVGAWVGAGVHGWWSSDKRWTAVMDKQAGEAHGPRHGRTWHPHRAAPDGAVDPRAGWWFLPLWQVVGLHREALAFGAAGTVHRTYAVLFCGHHANVANGAGGPRIIRAPLDVLVGGGWVDGIRALAPELTPGERLARDHLVHELRVNPKLARRFPHASY